MDLRIQIHTKCHRIRTLVAIKHFLYKKILLSKYGRQWINIKLANLHIIFFHFIFLIDMKLNYFTLHFDVKKGIKFVGSLRFCVSRFSQSSPPHSLSCSTATGPQAFELEKNNPIRKHVINSENMQQIPYNPNSATVFNTISWDRSCQFQCL